MRDGRPRLPGSPQRLWFLRCPECDRDSLVATDGNGRAGVLCDRHGWTLIPRRGIPAPSFDPNGKRPETRKEWLRPVPEAPTAVAGVWMRDGKAWVIRRDGVWAFPGGVIEVPTDRRPADALERIMRDTFRVECAVFATQYGTAPLDLITGTCLYVMHPLDEPVSADAAWFTPEELLRLPLAPTAREFAERWLAGAYR